MNPFEGYRISSPYGERIHPIDKTKKMHRGIDLVKPRGTPVNAFCGGVVIFAGEGMPGSGYGGYGNVVAVRDTYKKYVHVYAHLDAVYVKTGMNIKKAQSIGTLGNTGKSTGPHLHYEIRPNGYGTHVDPTKYLKELYKEVVYMLNREDAEKLIKLLSTLWHFVTSKQDRDEIARLADALRVASGQPAQNIKRS